MTKELQIDRAALLSHAMTSDLSGGAVGTQSSDVSYLFLVVDSSGQIVGAAWNEAEGTYRESLLRYHRPMMNCDAIDYDFYYEPGLHQTHPALDRLAFVLQPTGINSP